MSNLNYNFINKNSDKTIVFLHGWALDGNSFDNIINRLSEVSILKVDLFGFGKSDSPKDYFDTYEYSYQIFLLLKKLNINNIILVGHSFGGRLSILLSSIFNINVLYCILTSSAGINKFSLSKYLKIKFYKLIKLLVKLKILPSNILKKFGSNDYLNSNKIMKKILIKVVNQDLTFFAKKIKSKTYLIWDKSDKETPYYICKKLNNYIKYSQVVLFKTGGHFTAFNNVNKFSRLLNTLIT